MKFETLGGNTEDSTLVSVRNEKTGRNLLIDKKDLIDGKPAEAGEENRQEENEKSVEASAVEKETEAENKEEPTAPEAPNSAPETEAAPDKEKSDDEKTLEAIKAKLQVYEEYFKTKAGNVEYVKSIIADHNGDAQAGHKAYDEERDHMLTQSLSLQKEKKTLEEKIRQSNAV